MNSQRSELPMVGMSCASCAATVERILNQKVPGVISASVNFGTESATVEYDPSATDLNTMAQAVRNAGYELVLPEYGTYAISKSEESRKGGKNDNKRRSPYMVLSVR